MAEQFTIEWRKTNRGFTIGKFLDRYASSCSIQLSSLATEDCIWLGCDEVTVDPVNGRIHNSRMHLSREMAAALIPVLQYFTDMGELPPAAADKPFMRCRREPMAELRVENIKISEQFNARLLLAGVIMPLAEHPDELGEIVDATGDKVLQVDPDGTMPDEQVAAIAALIVLAVNTCGSFKAVPVNGRGNEAKRPCGECHLQSGEVCDICGAPEASR
jgi:hypothetical protein